MDFKEGDRVRLKPDVIKEIKKTFGENDETAYVDHPGSVKKVFSSGVMVKWDNGQGNVNPKNALEPVTNESIEEEYIKERQERQSLNVLKHFSAFVNESLNETEETILKEMPDVPLKDIACVYVGKPGRCMCGG